MITDEQIRKKLQTAIKTSGMTQKLIASKIGITQQSLNQYLTGRALPAIDTLANICKTLDLDANEILCLIENNETGAKTESYSSKYHIGTINNSGNIDMK